MSSAPGRSGTTALSEMLRQHPNVFVTNPKEPHFLALGGRVLGFQGPGDDIMVNRTAVTDLPAYRALYRGAGAKSARGDASVSTLFYPDASVPAIQHYFPHTRLVVLLREPVARAYSAFSYLRMRGFEPCTSFDDALIHAQRGERDSWHHLWQYIDMGRYARQIRPFLHAFGRHGCRFSSTTTW